ncbi:SDR family NAD(P)-dependent oxidoreductase [Rothia kristinae]|uniref:SDR family NAD(P)-dependent oxidoreductase n=1 Tax=Rothia kristinae TaxID=37923 RepID=A0A7T4T530_9MICC|nr:SDR family NAD(P)-dependent oxidoreductase [Rothia kristinae]QQC60182.1 SDR family NAD(P)-dependent oxidoreductase [Rothia kristinae]
MPGKTIVLTGASDGIGAAAARRLSADGHRVVVIGRSPEKTRAVAEDAAASSWHTADFARLDDVVALAQRLREEVPHIDVLAHNAGGVSGSRRTTTADGHETTFQVGFLSPYLLTRLLLPELIRSRAAVLTTSSLAHRAARLDPADLDLTHGYSEATAYGNAKLADLLLARELDRRHHHEGLSAASFHPGVVATGFARNSGSLMSLVYRTPARRLMRTSEDGADTLVWLAEGTAGEDWGSGTYYVRRRPAATSAAAGDTLLARRLWEAAEAMVADRLPEAPASGAGADPA